VARPNAVIVEIESDRRMEPYDPTESDKFIRRNALS